MQQLLLENLRAFDLRAAIPTAACSNDTVHLLIESGYMHLKFTITGMIIPLYKDYVQLKATNCDFS